jgi:hypothetical protein
VSDILIRNGTLILYSPLAARADGARNKKKFVPASRPLSRWSREHPHFSLRTFKDHDIPGLKAGNIPGGGAGRRAMTEDNNDQAADDWDLEKTERMQALLGPMHDQVMHAMVPYSAGRDGVRSRARWGIVVGSPAGGRALPVF